MYVYVVKCVNYFKIGHSKNPESRRKTIQTHNPLDVRICAVIKSENPCLLEKELHNLFSLKKSRGEWFELKHEDLVHLKTEYGFTFKIPLKKIFDTGDFDNSKTKYATKEVRDINLQVEDLVEYFEEIYDCSINNSTNIRKSIMKYGHESTKETIDAMFEKDYKPEFVLSKLFNLSKSSHLKKTNPEQYFIHRLKGMFWGRYRYSIDKDDIKIFKECFERINEDGEIEQSLQVFQSESYRIDWDEMLEYINEHLQPF